jgi:hypothetical protein
MESGAPFAPLYIPDEDDVFGKGGENSGMMPSIVLEQRQPQLLDTSSNGGVDVSMEDSSLPQPAITGFAMQIEELE